VQARRQSTDLAKQLDQPFEHEEKLTAASKRQQEILTALDITKNQASPNVDDSIGELAAQSQAECTNVACEKALPRPRQRSVVAKLT
jgi:hypothetical protein